ncbi:TRAP transporter small permease subunit [Roseomonas sp. OT10]|uniref:TRAP transporter small permease n=1 Tax=Roseomonas cutis TaxID=2897332 RepID=UPI001E51C2D7|nr:TRAP transporter small permease subunit [Roseomonas sp. OT10]UFN47365.1 TRAP transporter small permease subunit [Roseomonas sp. OT10]
MSRSVPAVAGRQAEPAAGRLLRGFARGLAWVARACVILAMVALVVLSVGQVVDRYLVKSTFDAYDQLSRLCLVWLTFIGIALGIRERANIRIELLEHLLPGIGTRALAGLLDVVVLLTSAYLVWSGWVLLEVGAYQAIMNTPLSYDVVYAGLLAGLALLAVFLLLRLCGVGGEMEGRGEHGP